MSVFVVALGASTALAQRYATKCQVWATEPFRFEEYYHITVGLKIKHSTRMQERDPSLAVA